MNIGRKLRDLRLAGHLSQGEIEKRTGLLRGYTSRVENGHITPSIATLEKYARALEVPLYTLFCNGRRLSATDAKPRIEKTHRGTAKSESRQHDLLVKAGARMNDSQRKLLLYVADKLARRSTPRAARLRASR